MASINKHDVLLVWVLLGSLLGLDGYVRADPLQGPFTITSDKIGSLNTKTILYTLNGNYVRVITDYGGRVEELKLASQTTRKLRDVLLTHHDDQQSIEDNKWWKGMLLLPWANRIDAGKYVFFDEAYQLPVNENTGGKTNALHGFMAGKEADHVEELLGENNAAVVSTYSIKNEEGYPFHLLVNVTHTLTADDFFISVTATNMNSNGHPLPFYMGWHPYFKCTAYKAVVTLDPCTKWNHVHLDSNMDPTGMTSITSMFEGSEPIGGTLEKPTFYDDEFKPLKRSRSCLSLNTKIWDAETNQTVVLWQDDSFPFVHVFTGSQSLFNEDAIAIEPMSAMADAYNNHDHLTTLSDGETWQGSFGVYVE